FLVRRILRQALHEREGGGCFYGRRRITRHRRCLDHVVPLAEFGRNSYRNLVSCCLECNSQKGERSAEEFLRGLYRERRLSDNELSGGLRGLDELAAGKLIPPVEPSTKGVKALSGVRLRPGWGFSLLEPPAHCAAFGSCNG